MVHTSICTPSWTRTQNQDDCVILWHSQITITTGEVWGGSLLLRKAQFQVKDCDVEENVTLGSLNEKHPSSEPLLGEDEWACRWGSGGFETTAGRWQWQGLPPPAQTVWTWLPVCQKLRTQQHRQTEPVRLQTRPAVPRFLQRNLFPRTAEVSYSIWN